MYGVYRLANIGENAMRLEIHINGKFRCISYPNEITTIKQVWVGNRITGITPGFFSKKIIFEFILTENEVTFDDY